MSSLVTGARSKGLGRSSWKMTERVGFGWPSFLAMARENSEAATELFAIGWISDTVDSSKPYCYADHQFGLHWELRVPMYF